DPDGDSLTFLWTQTGGTSVTLYDHTTDSPSFTSPMDMGVLTFRLRVEDGTDYHEEDLNITVDNQVPIADAGIDQYALAGNTVVLDGSGSFDPDGEDINGIWSQTSGTTVTLSDEYAIQPTFTAPAVIEVLTFSYAVNDGDEETSDTVDISVFVDDDPPTANAGPHQDVGRGVLVTLDGTGSTDPEALPLEYAWTQIAGPTVVLSGADTAEPTFTTRTDMGGTMTFELVVSDPFQDSEPDTVDVTTPGVAAIAEAGPDLFANGGEIVVLDANASFDPESGPLAFAWTQTNGTTLDLGHADQARVYLWMPDVTTSYTFEVEVTDEHGSDTDSVVLDVLAYAGAAVDLPDAPFAIPWDPGFNATTSEPFVSGSLMAVSGHTIPSGPHADENLLVVDVSDPTAPVILAGYDDTSENPRLKGFDGQFLFAMIDAGLGVYEYDPVGPTLSARGVLALPATYNNLGDLVVGGTHVFVAATHAQNGDFGLLVVDIDDPDNPKVLVDEPLANSVQGLTLDQGFLYVSTKDDLAIYDRAHLVEETPYITELTGDSDDDCPSIYERGLLVDGIILYQACYGEGLQIWNIANRASPSLLGAVPVIGRAYQLELDGDTLYVSALGGGLQVFDVSTRTDPVLIGAYATSDNSVSDFALASGAVALRNDKIDIYEFMVLPPALPAYGATFATTDEARRVALLGHLLSFDLAGGDWLQLLDASDPYALTALGKVDAGAELAAHRVADHLVTGHEYNDVHIVDVSDPMAPTLAGSYTTYNTLALDVVGTTAYVATQANGMRILDVSGATNPSQIGDYETSTTFMAIYVEDGIAYVGTNTQLHVVDVSDPADTALLGSVAMSSPKRFEVSEGRLYSPFGANGFTVYDVSDPPDPKSAQYLSTPNGSPEHLVMNGAVGFMALGSGGMAAMDLTDLSAPVLLSRVGALDEVETVALGPDYFLLADVDGGIHTVPLDLAWVDVYNQVGDVSSTLTYNVGWSIPDGLAEVWCFVTVGSCAVSNVDGSGQTATVTWTTPTSQDEGEIAIAVGDSSTFQVIRDRVAFED
ncbi:MAG: hypothetical protein JRI25_16045, partial [Deltaproteobacteria bacterium]|nr:hypothetical protein [Deltaproteobacteria bacterium]